MDPKETRETRQHITEDDSGEEIIHEERREIREDAPNAASGATTETRAYGTESDAVEPKPYTTEVVYRKSVVTSQSVFWAVFLICFGGFWLMYNFGMATFRFGKVVDYWPILLILWGISFLRVPLWIKIVLSASAAVLLALLLIAFIFGTAKFSFFGLR